MTMHVRGMYGLGDCLHQRAVLRALMASKPVRLETYYGAMYHDLVGDRLELSVATGKVPRIRDQVNASVSAPAPATDDRPLPPRRARPAPTRETKITYDREAILRHGSILAAQFASVGLPMPARPDFSLPVPTAWRAAATPFLEAARAAGKPLAVYRPIVANDVFPCPSRSPDPDAYAALFAAIRERFFWISVADLTSANERIVGAPQPVDLELHKGELTFEGLAGLFASAAIVFANPGFAPILAQAVGTPVAIVYGGNESFATTNRVGAHLAPTLAIEPVRPCACHQRFHACDKRIDLELQRDRLLEFVGSVSPAAPRSDQPAPPGPRAVMNATPPSAPRLLIFATTFIDTEERAELLADWLRLHHRLNPEADLLLVDSASPIPVGKVVMRAGLPETIAARLKVHDFGDNIGHLARGGRDGWGRAFSYGLEAAIAGGYAYVAHIEGDSLFRLPLAPIVADMARRGTVVRTPPVAGTIGPTPRWVETGLMVFETAFLASSGFVDRYDWPSRRRHPVPERVIHDLLGPSLAWADWRAARGDDGRLTAATARGFDWITHCGRDVYRAFLAAPPQSLTLINLGCGTNRLEGWQNFDRDIDIARRLPFPNGSADAILAEHVVEHVDYHTALRFFAECRRVLRTGGVVRIAVPSLERVWRHGDEAYFRFARKWAPSTDVRGAMHAILHAHGHKAAWTQSLLEASLFFAGFDEVTACEPGASAHAALRGVEGHGRVIGDAFNRIETVVVEGM